LLKAVCGTNPERGPQAMRKWLYQVARTTIADYWRSYYRLPTGSLDELSDAGWDGSAAGEPAMKSVVSRHPGERVKRLMQALPEHYCEVLSCRFLLNLSRRETATRLGLTEANVKVLQFRALKRAAVVEHVANRRLSQQKHIISEKKKRWPGKTRTALRIISHLERYIEELQAGRVAHVPAELTPDLARIYRMAMSFHAASTGAVAPRPEFIAQLQARLKHMEARHRAPLKQHRSCSSQERQEHPRLSRRARLRTGAVVAASFAVGAGIDHALEEQKRAAITSANAKPPPPAAPGTC
jgi:RNA polymerase sigma factor (sigma-70 family)